MGFYIRKSMKFGPIRLNLSKSGLGCSVGVKGFRIGVGPKGHYIHSGLGGLYYREYFNENIQTSESDNNEKEYNPYDYIEGVKKTYATDLSKLEECSNDSLINELNHKLNLKSWVDYAIIFSVVSFLLFLFQKNIFTFLFLITSLCFIPICKIFDNERKTTVLDYEIDLTECNKFLESFKILMSNSYINYVNRFLKNSDAKYSSGATLSVEDNKSVLSIGLPDCIESNIKVPTLKKENAFIYFFPDKILYYPYLCKKFVLIAYKDLKVERNVMKVVQTYSPSDAQVIGYTWQYVKKDGTPDLRFKNNPKKPIILEERLLLQSDTGLNVCLSYPKLRSSVEFLKFLKDKGATIDDENYEEYVKRHKQQYEVKDLVQEKKKQILELLKKRIKSKNPHEIDFAKKVLSLDFNMTPQEIEDFINKYKN